MSCRFPGAGNYERFWENLRQGLSSVTEIPEGRWDRDAFYSGDVREKNKTTSKWGGFVEGVEFFDADFFGVSAREAEVMDPQQRIMLEQVWNCIEDAGYDAAAFSGTNTGVYIGVFNFDYKDHLLRELESIEGHVSTGTHTALIPNRISHFLNLHGPSLPIDTACSSSLVALHKAAHAIRRGECDHALVGGVSVLCSPTHFISFSKTGMLSPDGSCKSFDERANGYVRGEGAAMLLLKPLDKAIADNDRIVAVVRGTAMNHGGRARTVTYPGSLAQSQVIAEALRQAQVPVSTVGYVEAHGTGTPKGDPIEVEGLKMAFARVAEERGELLAEHGCGIGSVKTNIGHLESVAGLAGLIKTVLCMRHATFPPLVHYQTLNPRISFDNTPFFIVAEAQPWHAFTHEDGTAIPRRAGISSFGFGGVNSHVIVEEYLGGSSGSSGDDAGDTPVLVILSAKTVPVLRERAKQLLTAIDSADVRRADLCDLAYTLQVGRQVMAARVAFVTDSFDTLRSTLEAWLANTPGADDVFAGEVPVDAQAAHSEEIASVPPALASATRDELLATARQWVGGRAFLWAAGYGAGSRRRVALPTYPFVRERHWVEARASVTSAPEAAVHPLVHRNTSTASGLRFSSRFTGAEFFLADHLVQGARTLPAAAQLEMARCALALAVTAGRPYRMRDVLWLRPMVVGAEPRSLHVALFPEGDGSFRFELYDDTDADGGVVFSEGNLVAVDETLPGRSHDLGELRRQCTGEPRTADACYALFDRIGLGYGAGHRGLCEMFTGENLALARIALPAPVTSSRDDYVLHPSLVDAALQATIAFEANDEDAWQDAALRLPFALASLEVMAPMTGDLWAVIRRRASHTFDVDLCNEEGTVCVRLGGFVTRTVPGAGSDALPRTALLQPAWTAVAASTTDAPRHAQHLVALCGGAGGFGVVPSDLRSMLPEATFLEFESGETSLAQDFESAAGSLLEYVQSIGSRSGAHLIQLVVPVDGAGSLMAGLAGMLRTAQRENPRIAAQVIHVETGQDIVNVLRENRDGTAPQVRYREGVRHVAVWSEWQPPSEPPTPWKSGGTYLITGGAGGLGLIFARDIAEQTRGATLVLTGRSPSTEATRRAIDDLEALGASAHYRQLDVGDRAAVLDQVRAIDAASGGLTGILHAAGILRDSFMARKTRDELRDVFLAKVSGTLNLDEASRDLALDCFVCFSSTSGALGNVGQADYAAGNAFMDAFAQQRAGKVAQGQRHGRTLSVNWPLWEAGGMQVDAGTRQRMAEDTGLIPLRTASGRSALTLALASGLPQVLVAEGDIRRFTSSLMVAGPAVAAIPSTAQPVHADGFREKAIRYFVRLLSTTLKRPANSIDARVAMEAYGIDSILVMDLTRALEQVFGTLSKTLLFEYQTIAALTGYFLQEHAVRLGEVLGEALTDSPATQPTVDNAESTATVPVPRRPRYGAVQESPRDAPRTPQGRPVDEMGDIAIIGLAGRYPQAGSLEEFWANLSQGKDSITEIPPERWDYRLYFDEDRTKPGKTYSKWGGFIDGVDLFDPLFFNISPREAELMDPQERLFLECVHATLEDAGYTRDNVTPHASAGPGNVGVFVGVMYEEYQLYGAQEQARGRNVAMLNSAASVANRISYFCNFNGPSMALDTMCSSSLTAIHLACQSLQRGDCSVAVAGGVNVSVHPNKYLMLAQGKFISGKGRCESFGEGGEGYVPGEGVGAVLLKPLAQAIADGDHVYGVIKATAVNHGGKTNGYTVPNPNAQAGVIEQALRRSGIDARAVSYIEAHGTGTSLGDPIEIAGLSKAFRSWTQDTQFCAIGSAKSNIGHCESAAGIAGVTKVLLQMKHRQLVPSLHSSVLNPNIDFGGTPFVVQQELAAWPRPVLDRRERPRVAGVSSFGAGGANAHVVIEEYAAPAASRASEGPALVVLSSRHEDRLREQVQRLLAALASDADISLADLAYTLQVGREPMEERLALVVGSRVELREKLTAYAAGETAIDDLYRGQVKRNKEALAAITDDEDMDAIVEAWIRKGKFGKLLDLWVKGLTFDWQRLYDGSGDRPRRVSLPTYPFARERYWIPLGPTASVSAGGITNVLHPLLQRNTSDVDGLRFSTRLTGEEFVFADHVVQGMRMLPGVAQLEMARQAASEVMGTGAGPLRLKHVAWIRPVTVGAEGIELHVALYPEAPGELGFDIYSDGDDGEAVTYSQGSVFAAAAAANDAVMAHDLAAIRAQCDVSHVDAAQCYERFERVGLNYGPAFQGVVELFVGKRQVLARIALPPAAPTSGYVLHPSLLDAALQATLGLSNGTLMLPFALGGLEILGACPAAMWAVVRYSAGTRPDDRVQRLDVDLCDEHGRVCVRFIEFSLRPATSVAVSGKPVRTLLMAPAWESAAPSATTGTAYASHVVMLCDGGTLDVEADFPDAVCLLPETGPDLVHRFEAAAAALLPQIQSLASRSGKHLIQVVVPTQGAGQAMAGLGGMLRTAQRENPRIVSQLIAVEPGQDIAQALRENHGDPAQHVRYTESRREVAGWREHVPGADTLLSSVWKAQGVYLITGGAGGLGLIFAREIARQVRNPVLILTGRSMVNEQIAAHIRQLETLGAVVQYHAVDVADAVALTQLVRGIPEAFESLDGIVHSAGVVRDSYIARKTPQELHEVLAAKVAGTVNLDEASRDMALDCFICFSSIAGAVGNVGQADYAAANAFMDAFAHHRASQVTRGERHGRTLSVNWPLWDEGGMRADAATRAMLLQQWGMHALATDSGVLALRQALHGGQTQMLVVAGDTARIREAVMGEPHGTVASPPSRDASEQPAVSPGKGLSALLLRALAATVSSLIKVKPEDIDGDTSLSEYGFDSISLTEFSNALNQQYRLDLTPTIFFEYPTLDGLASYLAREHAAALEPQLARPEPSAMVADTASPSAIAVAHPTPFEGGRSRGRRRMATTLAASTTGQTQPTNAPIAIVGMSGEFPQARDIDAFWRNLLEGRDCIADMPAQRTHWAAWHDERVPERQAGTVTRGGFIDGMDEFDPTFFGISPKEAELMDPQQRLMMTHVWKALEDAGYGGSALTGSDTAIYVGTMASGYGALISRSGAAIEGYSSTGAVASVGPNRMSYYLDFHGPSEPVETACSSSLVALRRAVLAIQRGDCRVAIAGGVNTIINPELHISFGQAGMLSEDGRCKTFSGDANGYVRGEGVAMLVLKSLSDAERDGDHIYGLVRGTAENHGGRANSLTAPNPHAQAAVVRQAHRQAGFDPRSVGYIEAHGTGTPLGDPVEISGLKGAFKDLYAGSTADSPHCGLGSVKTNIGHLELAAGVAGVIKVLLQMKHRTLVKSLHSDSLNPYIDLTGSPFYVLQEMREWIPARDAQGQVLPLRAGVSSFGFGGVNAHVVLEEYVPSSPRLAAVADPVAVLLSARSDERLREQVRELVGFLASPHAEAEIDLVDLAYTLQVGREAMEQRLGMVAYTLAELRDKLERFLDGDRGIDELHSGQVARNREAVTASATDEDMAQTVDLGKLIELWVRGHAVDWRGLYRAGQPRRISLPTYAFARERYWVPGGNGRAPTDLHARTALHPLVQRNSSTLSGPRFTSRFDGSEFVLADHVVVDSRVLPGVAQLEMARFAASEAMGGATHLRLTDIVWARPVVVGAQAVDLHVSLHLEDNGDVGYDIHSGMDAGMIVHGRGVVRKAIGAIAPPAADIATLRTQCTRGHFDAATCYAAFDAIGLHYGNAFRGLSELFVGENVSLARVTLPDTVGAAHADYVLHPGLLDAALQSTIGQSLVEGRDAPVLMLPFSLGSLDIFAPCVASMWAVIRSVTDGVDIDLCDDDGVVCVRMTSLGFRPVAARSEDAPTVVEASHASVPATLPTSADTADALHKRAVAYFVRFLSTTLKLPAQRIDAQARMETYGIDSLLVLDLTRSLEKTFGPLPKTLFFEYQTIAALSGYFLAQHAAAMTALLGEKRAVAAALSAPSATKKQQATSVPVDPQQSRSRYAARGRDEAVNAVEVGAIAIIGVAGRYPQAGNLDAFWSNLSQGKDSITEIPVERWDHTLYFDADRHQPGKTYGKWGGFIDGVDLFDPLFFNISPREAELMDPQERLFLECVHATLEDAGYTRDNVADDGNVGVFVGVMYEEYQLYGAQEQARGRGIAVPGHPASIANRVSYFSDFRGPSMALDTMCSSSLTAIHLACQSLQRGGCEVAIAGGVNVSIHPNKYLMLAQGKFISGKGRCESFGEGGEGYVPGEGVGAVLLKPLHRAIADGDQIYGVIRATAVNHGGKTNGYTVPNPNAQAKVIEQALREGGIDARAVSYIEAHGTGTSLGDPIEIAGLSKAFRSWTPDTQFCAIGSAKSNIGHCESAAGIAGVTKVLLQMKHRQLVPSLHSGVLNPNIDFDDTPFVVQQALAPWPRLMRDIDGVATEGTRIAGISSFGAGGANAHVVIEEYVPTAVASEDDHGPVMVVISARDDERLRERAQGLSDYLGSGDGMSTPSLHDLAFTLQVGRDAMEERLALVVQSLDELREKLGAYLAGEAAIDELYRGQVKRNKEALAGLAGDADMAATVDAWIAKGKYGKLLELWVRGLPVDWQRLYRETRPRRISLPTYPFARERYWVPAGPASLHGGQGDEALLHPLLHRNTSTFTVQRFSSRFHGNEFFLADHVVRGLRVLPGVAHLEMAYRATLEAMDEGGRLVLNDIVWARPAVVDAGGIELHIALVPHEAGGVHFEIYRDANDGDTVTYSHGAVSVPVGETHGDIITHDLTALRLECAIAHLGAAECYALFDAMGLDYGAGFQGLGEVFAGAQRALARIMLPTSLRMDGYTLHPALLDAALQAAIGLVAAPAATTDATLWLPVALGSLEVIADCVPGMWAVVTERAVADSDGASRWIDVDLCDDTGAVCVRLTRLVLRASIVLAEASASMVPQTLLARPVWEAQALRGEPTGRRSVARHLLLLCGVEGESKDEVTRRWPGATCIAIDGGADVATTYELAAGTLLEQIQSHGSQPGQFLIQVVVPVRGIGQTLAGLGAMLRTAALENPAVVGHVIGVEAGQDIVRALLENHDSAAHQIRYLDGARQVGGWAEWKQPSSEMAPVWKAGATYLITGGAGGLGLIFARDMARQAPGVTLVLTGRSPLTDAMQARFAELEAIGAVVHYMPLDVGDREAVRRCVDGISARFGLHGIIHSAGVLRDSFIIRKTKQELQEVLRAKVAGTLNLDDASRDLALDCFLCFSSIAGVRGNVGQADYAAANGFMDAFAQHRSEMVAQGLRHGQTLSVNWPLWDEGGMQVDAGTRRHMLQETGMTPLRTDIGCAALARTMASGLPQVLVAEGRIDQLKATLLTDASVAAARGPVEPVETIVADVGQATPADMRERAIRYLVHLVSATLKLPPHKIDPEAALEAYGIDSVLILDLTVKLETSFGPLPKTLFFEYQSLGALAGYFLKGHGARLAALVGEPLVAAAPRPVAMPAGHAKSVSTDRSVSRFGRRGSDPGSSDIAIVGVAGRYPQAGNLAAFWANLSQGKDSITEIPVERWDHAAYFDEDRSQPGKTYGKWGGFIDGVDLFDPLFFNISPREAELMDPQERLFLECVHATLEDAGYTRDNVAKDSDVGVFVGVMYEEYQLYGAQEQARGRFIAMPGSPASIANRISYFFNFNGPSMALDTMCSSSLTAIHLACQSLQRGDCAVAVAGGVNVSVHPNKYLMLAQGKFISGKGRCESFGEGGEGYVPGEGVGAVLLKPLAQAKADGDHIYGVIKATAVNHGGKTNGYTVPNPNAQAKVVEKALRRSGIDARSVSYIEAHGTGTSLGDPIEIAGLSKAFRSWTSDTQFCAIGSAKSNIGHCESAAGIAGVTKVLLQMKHQQLVPSLHSRVLNPNIDFADTPFVVQQDLAPWPRPTRQVNGLVQEGSRIAGISSFGAGGANAHIVIEEYVATATPWMGNIPALIVLSARNEDRLHVQVGQLLAAIEAGADTTLAELAYTLQVGRDAMDERLALRVDSLDELREKLAAWLTGENSADLYRGQVKRNKEAMATFTGDDDVSAVVDAWMIKGKFDRLLDGWVKGLAVDWRRLYGDTHPRRISLPTYPFARERYWVPEGTQAAVVQAVASAAAAETLTWQPVWTAQGAATSAGDDPVFASEVVLFAGLDSVDALRLQAHLPYARRLVMEEDKDTATLYELAAAALLDAIQSLVGQPGKHLIQVLVPCDGDLQMLQGLSGMLRTAQLESPRIVGRVIAVEAGQDMTQVVGENRVGDAQQVRYVRGERQVTHWTEFASRVEAALPWKAHGVYLITGGAGGLGLIVARDIASRVKNPVLILTGRSPLDEAIKARLRPLEALGAVLRYHAVDVADAEAVSQLVRGIPEEFESLDGIIHSAGVIRDSFLVAKTPEELHEVFAAKVAGTLNLDEASRDIGLDFFVCFSSIAAVLGSLGQADYAAANGFMDAFAHHRAGRVMAGHRQGHTLSINWPLWDEGGMHVDAATRAMLQQQSGMHAMASDEGIHALAHVFAAGMNQALVVAGDAAHLRMTMQGTASASASAAAAPLASPLATAATLGASLKGELVTLVSGLIKVKPEDLDGGTTFSEFGFDSVSLTEFSNALNLRYQLRLAPTIFFEHPTLDGLADHLLREHSDSLAARFAVTEPVTVVSSAAPTTSMHELPGRIANEPVAIIGMSGQFPQARDLVAFWDNLREGRDCISEIPPDRWDRSETKIAWGGFIDGVDEFDPLFFGISPKEAELMDPQQRLMMIHVWKALEDAGYAGPALSGSDTSIFVGTGATGYGTLVHRAGMGGEAYASTGGVPSVGPNRISYLFDWHGASEPVETACSSSLGALRRGVMALQNGDSSIAIVGGVNTIVTPEPHISFNKAGMLCDDGRCKTFSSEANGYVRGEGAAMLVLKRLSDAERDGDHIHGVIRGVAENHGGHANSLTAPNPKAQAAVVRKAHEQAGIDPRTVTYIEAHGTGTPLGDPVEINGLKAAFQALYANTQGPGLGLPHCGIG